MQKDYLRRDKFFRFLNAILIASFLVVVISINFYKTSQASGPAVSPSATPGGLPLLEPPSEPIPEFTSVTLSPVRH